MLLIAHDNDAWYGSVVAESITVHNNDNFFYEIVECAVPRLSRLPRLDLPAGQAATPASGAHPIGSNSLIELLTIQQPRA